MNKLIASEGLQIESFHSCTTTCCPSRTSLLRGQYAHNTRLVSNNAPWGGYRLLCAGLGALVFWEACFMAVSAGAEVLAVWSFGVRV